MHGLSILAAFVATLLPLVVAQSVSLTDLPKCAVSHTLHRSVGREYELTIKLSNPQQPPV